MNLHINNKMHTLVTGSTITKMLQHIEVSDHTGLAIAVNEQVVPRKKWDEFLLKENDKILLIKATQGG